MARCEEAEASASLVVPTHVGMARVEVRVMKIGARSPHARGDGPEAAERRVATKTVVPTHVGMARSCSWPYFAA